MKYVMLRFFFHREADRLADGEEGGGDEGEEEEEAMNDFRN